MAKFVAPLVFVPGLEASTRSEAISRSRAKFGPYSFFGVTSSADRFIERASRADMSLISRYHLTQLTLSVLAPPALVPAIFKLRKDPLTQLGSLEACLIPLLLIFPPLPSVIEFTKLDKSTENLSDSVFTIQAAKRNDVKDDES
ncbi:hypothetical protein K438DRAFT_1947069 [Mycena galopus ATCC 62051]|nr:hypothetical protein K438DRAFT_1947069 [Mycena galopus ATCC 62051]